MGRPIFAASIANRTARANHAFARLGLAVRGEFPHRRVGGRVRVAHGVGRALRRVAAIPLRGEGLGEAGLDDDAVPGRRAVGGLLAGEAASHAMAGYSVGAQFMNAR